MVATRVPRVCNLLYRTNRAARRWQSTLEQNKHIYIFPNPSGPPSARLLSLLPTDPPTSDLAVASTTELPPTPASVTENPRFMSILQEVVGEHATQDPTVQASAAAFASQGGAGLGSGGVFFPGQQRQRRQQAARRPGMASARTGGGGAGGDGAGGASGQGGAGGGGAGGFVHVADQRNPPDWGRIPYPEDILGSLQVNGEGNFVGEKGEYQESGTYRICTREGILNLSPYLRERLVERLQRLEASERSQR